VVRKGTNTPQGVGPFVLVCVFWFVFKLDNMEYKPCTAKCPGEKKKKKHFNLMVAQAFFFFAQKFLTN
jgi:hypothetical protein